MINKSSRKTFWIIGLIIIGTIVILVGLGIWKLSTLSSPPRSVSQNNIQFSINQSKRQAENHQIQELIPSKKGEVAPFFWRSQNASGWKVFIDTETSKIYGLTFGDGNNFHEIGQLTKNGEEPQLRFPPGTTFSEERSFKDGLIITVQIPQETKTTFSASTVPFVK